MIYYLVTAEHSYTMGSFLESWGRALAGRITIVPDEAVFAGRQLPVREASYIFSDLDRLNALSRQRLGPLHDTLVNSCGAARVLNDPLHSLLRFDFLRTLREKGINRFDVYRVSDRHTPKRFPVFIRRESGFEVKAPPLLNTAAEYEEVASELQARPSPLADLIGVEFCDTADKQGIYRKYGAFTVGETIVPRHVFFSRNWMVKDPDLGSPAMIEEELAFMQANPHAKALREIFRIANISYGRIDYSLLNGKLQIWEINTNPLPASFTEVIPQRRAAHLRFVEQIGAAFEAIDSRQT
jgi:hypothetical protein